MRTLFTLFFTFSILTISIGQSDGDYRTISNGDWDDNIWETFAGGWAPAGMPPFAMNIDFNVDIRHAVTVDNIGSNFFLIVPPGVLRINSEASLEIATGVTFLNFAGTENIVLKSDASGTGNLLLNDADQAGTLEVYLSANKWHLVGPPVSTLSAADAFLTGYMQTWSDGNPGSWTIQEGNPALTLGRGAAYYFPSNFTASMEGTLNGSAVTINGLSNAGGADDGWHLLANPFPCGITIPTNNTNFTGTLGTERYVYNGASYVQKTTLAPSQGFFVRVTSAGNYTFPQSIKTISNTTEDKSTDTDYLKLSLSDNMDISNDELIVRFNENATEDFDTDLDGIKLVGNPEAGEFMTELENDLYGAITSIPYPNQIISVPVYFKKGNATEYNITLSENKMDNLEITLYDIVMDKEINLNESNTYDFTVNDSISERFVLQFKNASSVSELQNNSQVNIHQISDNIIIEQENPQNGEINIFNISGKLLKSKALTADKVQQISISNQPSGIYIVKLTFNNVTYSEKIIK